MRPALLRTSAGRVAGGVLAAVGIAVLAGMTILWPSGKADRFEPLVLGGVEGARVLSVAGDELCRAQNGRGCRVLGIEVTGDDRHSGDHGTVILPGTEATPEVDPGDSIRVIKVFDPNLTPGTPQARGQDSYSFVDFERRGSLLWLVLAFAGLVLVLGRLHGARALTGLAVSLVVLLVFVVPAILDGAPPLLVALIGALAVMLATIGIAHGLGVKSAAAMLGTTASLLLTALLALVAVELVHVSGTATEDASLLRAGTQGALSLQGLALAGVVVGALGVLDDVTVSQASTVLALQRTDPGQPLRTLVARALEVGRDHLGATVNTLALAYAGAALPALLVFHAQGTGAGDALNREPVAAAIVGAVVGSIGLLAAVPLTTVLAGVLARAVPPEELPADTHAHHH